MFKWLRRLWQERKLRQRALFRFWDGETTRWADPFLAWRKLIHHEKINLLEMSPMVDQGIEPETTIMVEGLAEIFGVNRWDGQSGLTDWEILNILAELEGYFAGLKKSTNPGPTSSVPTASESSTSPDVPAEVTS